MTSTEDAAGVEEHSPRSNSDGSDGYVVPLVHTHVPRAVVDGVVWGTLGTVAIAGALQFPVVGAAAAGALVIRWRHRH